MNRRESIKTLLAVPFVGFGLFPVHVHKIAFQGENCIIVSKDEINEISAKYIDDNIKHVMPQNPELKESAVDFILRMKGESDDKYIKFYANQRSHRLTATFLDEQEFACAIEDLNENRI